MIHYTKEAAKTLEELTAENATLKEDVAVLKSQVENADVNLEQARMNALATARSQWRAKVEDAEKRIAVVEAQANTALDELETARARIAELEGVLKYLSSIVSEARSVIDSNMIQERFNEGRDRERMRTEASRYGDASRQDA